MDWSDDELEELGNLSIQYSGVESLHEEVEVTRTTYSVEREVQDFCQGSLMEYSQTNPICSTSWATSIIEIAESITGKLFSVDQLLQCLSKQENIDGCQGIHPKTLATYLLKEGLVEMKDFTDCESLKEKTHYHFATVYPSSPKAGGLMNLIAEGIPVFAMVAFDLVKLRFVKYIAHDE